MIFVGDIAIPFCNLMKLQNFPEDFSSKNLFGNLEGEIIDNSLIDLKKTRAVFNDRKTIADLVSEFNFIGFALANNHITDLTGHQFTINYLNEINVPFCGIGENIIDASKPLMLIDGEIEVVILNFGWEIIQCEVATNKSPGVNPLQKNHVVTVLCDTVAKYPKAKIIPYMHWSYELEAEPQPFERELARKMIDSGAAGVIGSHPHRVGGFEMYNGKPIVYSLGNWMFKQNYYFDGKLSFPDFCNLELAFDWDLANDDFKFHFFNYDREKSELKFLRTEGRDSPTMREHTPFLNLSEKEYRKWYRENHYHKNKGLPIYYWDDSVFTVKMKSLWNKSRDYLLKLLLNKGK
jgi:poly-gamma-glutamate synthesis protein (capsule biosynthesis protein)